MPAASRLLREIRERGEDYVRAVLMKLYQEHTIEEMASIYEVSYGTMWNMMKKLGIESRDHDEKFIHGINYSQEFLRHQFRPKQLRDQHPAWKGGEHVDPQGYRRLYEGDGRYAREHRKVIEEQLGRELTPDEVVHHKNRDKTDNTPENLEVVSREVHAERHEADEEEWD